MTAIIYDMDGTIVHFQIDYIRARRNAINVLIKHGIPDGRYSIENSITESARDARLFFKETLGYDADKIKNIMSQVNQQVVKIEMEAAIKATAIPNIQDLLDFGRGNRLHQIICTYNTNAAAELTLQTAKLSGYFDAIYGRDDVLKPKPNPSHLEEAVKEFGIRPKNSILIGDHSADIKLGKNFGCKTIGVDTEHNAGEVADADFIVQPEHLASEAIRIILDNYAIKTDY